MTQWAAETNPSKYLHFALDYLRVKTKAAVEAEAPEIPEMNSYSPAGRSLLVTKPGANREWLFKLVHTVSALHDASVRIIRARDAANRWEGIDVKEY